MQVPLEITFRGIEPSEYIKRLVEEKAQKLEMVYANIISCHVAVERVQESHHKGNPCRVRIDLMVPPGHEIVVREESAKGLVRDSLPQLVRNAFRSARRQLLQVKEKQRHIVKNHPMQDIQAIVSKVFSDKGYGFLKNLQGEEVYFHKNSVLHGDFERMTVGTGVRYVEESGEKGQQASSVQIVSKPSGNVSATPVLE